MPQKETGQLKTDVVGLERRLAEATITSRSSNKMSGRNSETETPKKITGWRRWSPRSVIELGCNAWRMLSQQLSIYTRGRCG